MKINIIEKIKKWYFGVEVPPYPYDFCIIDYSVIAKQNGIKDEQNKIIFRYFFDEYGNRKIKKYPYTKQRAFALKEVHNIPIFDKTIQKETGFPVFGKILPSEVEWSSL